MLNEWSRIAKAEAVSPSDVRAATRISGLLAILQLPAAACPALLHHFSILLRANTMSPSRPVAHSSMPCCTTVIRTQGHNFSARIARRFNELLDQLVAWRCRLHEGRYRPGKPRHPF